jgi:hypothetical protein
MPISPTNSDIGARLIEKKVISEDQLIIALKERARLKEAKTVGAILVEMGFVSEGVLGEILNETSGVKKFDIKSSIIDSKLVKKVPKEFFGIVKQAFPQKATTGRVTRTGQPWARVTRL